MENKENINTNTRNFLSQNLGDFKNNLPRYGVAIGAIFIVLIIIFSMFFKSSSDEIEKKAEETTYDTKSRNFVLETIENETPEQKESAVQNTETKEFPVIEEERTFNEIIKTGIVIGEAANSARDSQFKNTNVFLDIGQNTDDTKRSGNGSGGGDMGEIFSPTAAHFSNFDRNFLLAKGTYIGCSLKTKLVSDIKGGIACIVSNDVYSDNGHTLLIEKGSIVTGTYNGGSVEEGMKRIYVIWQEIRTPNNIVIPVFSGASDQLGAAGIEGWVDNHYFKRFGSAILISMIDDAIGALTTHLSRSAQEALDYSQGSMQTANELAKKTLEKMINVKPTLYKNHGDIVGIYVNRDIDFSNVYELRRKNYE